MRANNNMNATNILRPADTSALGPTPAALGYSMPAEWSPHAATWLAWPHNAEDWPGKFEPIPWIYAEIVRLLAQRERVHIFVQSAAAARQVTAILARSAVDLKNVKLHPQKTDRVWTRDSGPIFVTRASRRPQTQHSLLSTHHSALAITDWKFNAWAKYDNSALDDALPRAAAKLLKPHPPVFTPYGLNNSGEYQRFVLEGGSIDVNGAGCLLTTEECLLSKIQERNPGFTRPQIEKTLCDYLGVTKILWLDRGIAGDDTHGHIDDTARFTDATTIVACVESNKRDPNHAVTGENLKRLATMRDAGGKPFTIAELPMPAPVIFDGQRLPASYANFYIANAGVLVPAFNDPNDTRALKVIEQCFPGRDIIPVYCRDLVWGLGTLHCMTQQQPS